MKTLLFSLFATAALHAAPEALFDGKSLDGWRVEKAPYWTVKDGILVGESDESENKAKGSILWTEKQYRDFVFETEFKYSGKIDSGVFLRNSNDQIQIGISGSLKRDMTGSPYIATLKKYPVEAAGVAALLKEGEWNTLKITAKGSNYVVVLNGKEVLSYDSTTSTEKGSIGFQVHPNLLMKVEFREIKITEI